MGYTYGTMTAMHVLLKFVFLASFIILVVFWPSISLITLISIHVGITILYSTLKLFGALDKGDQKHPSNIKYFANKDRIPRLRNDEKNASGWLDSLDTLSRILVFHLEDPNLTTINILYIIVLLANLNFFFQYQTNIVPPYSLRPALGNKEVTPVLGKQDHLLFQDLSKKYFEDPSTDTEKEWASNPLAQQVHFSLFFFQTCQHM